MQHAHNVRTHTVSYTVYLDLPYLFSSPLSHSHLRSAVLSPESSSLYCTTVERTSSTGAAARKKWARVVPCVKREKQRDTKTTERDKEKEKKKIIRA